MRYYLGLDNGGTNTKAALFTPDGTQVAVESVATAALTPAPGFVERDMEDMWRDNCAVIRSALEKSGVRADEIAGVGLCVHGKGLYLLGKDDRPARRGILSADNRAWKYPVEWREDGTEENFVFVSSDADGFHFYSNGELVQIAQRYYKANSTEGYVPGMAGTQNNDDGTVTIQLYDSLEDHNSTSAWYTIDRVTLTGTDDMTGSTVNMSDYAEAGTAEG